MLRSYCERIILIRLWHIVSTIGWSEIGSDFREDSGENMPTEDSDEIPWVFGMLFPLFALSFLCWSLSSLSRMLLARKG